MVNEEGTSGATKDGCWGMLVEIALGVVSNLQLEVLPDVHSVRVVCSFRAT
jgi:hypothetical protein